MIRLGSGKLKPKTFSKAQSVGQQGINLIEGIVLRMGCAWNPTNLDMGIDGYIEICDPTSGAALNCIVQVQSKATEGSFAAETASGFEFICEERDLRYWLNGNAPVILVRSRPKTGEAYWISIKDYFQDLERRKTRKIVFDKSRNRFDESCREALIELAVPADSGLYLAPVPRREKLCTNLLPLARFPERIYLAETGCRFANDIWSRCRGAGSAWLLKRRQLLSFYDLGEPPWTEVCDRGSVDEYGADEWALSDDPDIRRDFVQLLNMTLKDMLRKRSIWFDGKEGHYFYAPTPNLFPRRVAYMSNLQKTHRTVFLGYPEKRDSSKMAFYRHSAFEGYFVRHEGIWYLEITPTYRYTSDGQRIHPYSADMLSKMKRLERPQAVHGQVVMWSRLLRDPLDGGLFKGEEPLAFGELVEYELDAGIYDQAWLKREEDAGRIMAADGTNEGEDASGQLALIDYENRLP